MGGCYGPGQYDQAAESDLFEHLEWLAESADEDKDDVPAWEPYYEEDR